VLTPEKVFFVKSLASVQTYAVLWDLDGVICDSADLHYLSWVEALNEHGIPFSRQVFNQTFGMNNTGVIKQLLGDPAPELLEAISGRKEILFRQALPGHLSPLPGVEEWLERLSMQGISMAVASSAPLANILLALDELGLRLYFEAIVSVAGRQGKPDPLVFLEAAEKLKMPPERCIVIEDALAGLEAARRAGMRCIAVTTTNPAEALQGADLVVERLDLLPDNIFQRLVRS
jgi:HAD superfamily hydrolase (TIGR01509 family)